jgi:hypothetical protein
MSSILDPLRETGEMALDVARAWVLPPAQLLINLLGGGSRQQVIDHWHDFAEDFHMDPLEFYELVHDELKRREVPGLHTFCVTHGEGGVGTAHRLYLRLDRNWGHFDICAAPFGTGFFFSYRYIVPTPLGFFAKVLLGTLTIAAVGYGTMFLRVLPLMTIFVMTPIAMVVWVIGVLSWSKDTYYRQDTSMMYLSTVPHVIKSLSETVMLRKGARLEERVTSESAGA